MKPKTEINLRGSESQLAGGRPVGFVQAQPRSWTRDYLEQIQLVVRAGPEPGISRFQIRRPNHSATRVLVCYGQYSHECCLLSKQRVCFCLHGAMWMNLYKVMTSDMPAETDIHFESRWSKKDKSFMLLQIQWNTKTKQQKNTTWSTDLHIGFACCCAVSINATS